MTGDNDGEFQSAIAHCGVLTSASSFNFFVLLTSFDSALF